MPFDIISGGTFFCHSHKNENIIFVKMSDNRKWCSFSHSRENGNLLLKKEIPLSWE
ncbi:MAG: hypothetical protein GQ525_15860 [Draconibacterium sp.]|nr:hypothetical protein [Draconibacterium sp.]